MIESLFKGFLKKAFTTYLKCTNSNEMTFEEYQQQLKMIENSKDIPHEVPLNASVTLKITSNVSHASSDLELINNLYNKAIKYLDVTIYELRFFLKKLSLECNILSTQTYDDFEPLIQLIKTIFHINFDQHIKKTRHQIHQLLSKLEKTRSGLYADNRHLYIANLEQRMILFGKFSGEEPLGRTDIDNDNNTIYINFSLLAKRQLLFISTLIHEASHLFSKTEDYDYYNSGALALTTTPNERLQWKVALYLNPDTPPTNLKFLNHAQSLEIFVMELVNTKQLLHHKIAIDEQFQDRLFTSNRLINKV